MQGMYELWSNLRVSGAAILWGHQASTVERIRQQESVLAIQDTSELNYSEHRKGPKGLEPISNPEARGIKLHTVLAVSDAGVPMGVLHQQMWSREVNRGGRKERRSVELRKRKACARSIA